jgi:hypothetical protein
MTSRIEIDILLPLWHQSTKKGKEGARRSKSLVILTTETTLGVVVVRLHGHPIGGGKRGEGMIIKRRNQKGELIELVDTHPIGKAPLVAYAHLLALTSVTTPSKHALKHLEDTAGGGRRRAGQRRSSYAKTSRPRRSWGEGHIPGNDRSYRELGFEIGNLMVLQELNLGNYLNHHLDLWGIPTTTECCPRDTDYLLNHVVKYWEPLFLNREMNKVLLVLRTSGRVSNPRSQSSTEKVVKSVQLWKKV